MRSPDLASAFFQVLLIFILSIGGAYVLSKYPIGVLYVEGLCMLVNKVIHLHILDAQTVLTILAGLLFLFGTWSVVIKGGNGKGFLSLIGLLILPSTLSLSFIQWAIWLNYLFGVPLEFLKTEISFTECYLFMMLWVIGNISFRFISMFKGVRQDLEARGGDPEDLDRVFIGAHSLMFLSMTGIFLVFTVPLIPLSYINEVVYFLVDNVPLGLIVLGVVFSLIIPVSTYFLVKKLLGIG